MLGRYECCVGYDEEYDGRTLLTLSGELDLIGRFAHYTSARRDYTHAPAHPPQLFFWESGASTHTPAMPVSA